ncbi:hypothetical protein HPB52_007835 [Rhipicephalus sanguineus]|uniref:Uncharacterized protein n=1 Tax=Rhipicephalus sanguineus TaxID=34632 RepID=A0A9D4QA61_RHISA|nr:hypothetical protein HPB52_007835 [Rhipicephalus sanguineus]
MHRALETTIHDSMAQFWEQHGVMDKAEYISVLRVCTPRPTRMLPRIMQPRKTCPSRGPTQARLLREPSRIQFLDSTGLSSTL